MRFVDINNKESKKILEKIKKNSAMELFDSIPENLKNSSIALPKAKDERELKKSLNHLNATLNMINFLGAGACEHFVPEWINQQLLRAEWYTSYTPYQAEVAQGNLQALFEFQTMTKSLLGQEIANASMYDGATALAEAVLLAYRVNKKSTVLVSSTIHPHYRDTLKTYLSQTPIEIVTINFSKEGKICEHSLNYILKSFADNICCAAIQTPNFFGLFEDTDYLIEKFKEQEIFSISVTTDCSALGLMKPLGDCGFDVSVADGIGLVGALNMGGPGVGLFATKKQYLRQIPGRLVGMTTDKDNNQGFVLTLSTREQHIRREKATSNICTNNNLIAMAFAMTLSSYGKDGFIDLGYRNIQKTLYLRKKLLENKITPVFNGEYYNETVIKVPNASIFLDNAKQKNIIAGLHLEEFYPSLNNHILLATTELHSNDEIDILVNLLKDAINE